MKPLDYDRVMENIGALLELKRPETRVVVSMIRLPENRGEEAVFRSLWTGKPVEPTIWNPTDFGGEVPLLSRQRLRRKLDFLLPPAPCLTALVGMTILHDGRVALCSRDYEGEVILGDVSKDSIRGVWNSPLAREIRLKHLEGGRGALRMCHGCPGYNLPLELLFRKA
jgi:MoaA/NifB/PqqE/SkfB family radical SAM enzyme